MKHSTSVPRRALRGALALAAAGGASLALAGTAGAVVMVIQPDGNTGTDHLGAAIATANTNTSTSNTIILMPGKYIPQKGPINITKNLTISGDHSFQSPTLGTGGILINGANVASANPGDFMTIGFGVNVRMDGFEIDSAGTTGFSAINNSGTLTTYGVAIFSSGGFTITNSGTFNGNETTLANGFNNMLVNPGTANLNNVSIIGGSQSAIVNSGTYNLNNTAVVGQTGVECPGTPKSANGGPGSTDDDGTCGVQYPNNTTVSFGIPSPNTNGGPTNTIVFPSNTQTTGKGVNCPTVDGRFFVNPKTTSGGVTTTTCDIGATTTAATRQTTPPSCTVTGGSAGPPKTQQVSLIDSLSGTGPQTGAGTDNPSNTIATAYPPPAAVPLAGYAVTNLQINNGTVAFTPSAAPSTSPLILTATKTTQTSPTQWSFTGMNWAGIAQNCY